jgi:hypothetical protein
MDTTKFTTNRNQAFLIRCWRRFTSLCTTFLILILFVFPDYPWRLGFERAIVLGQIPIVLLSEGIFQNYFPKWFGKN